MQLKHKIRFDAMQICFNAANIKILMGYDCPQLIHPRYVLKTDLLKLQKNTKGFKVNIAKIKSNQFKEEEVTAEIGE